jgi:hypothetical protein
MRAQLVPLEREPVHGPFIACPGGQYRYEPVEDRRAALLAVLHGVQLGAYDERIVGWLAWWEVSTVAVAVSLPWRTRKATAQQTGRGGGEPR